MYVSSGRTVLGDAAPAVDFGTVGAMAAKQLADTAAAAAANPDNAFTQASAAALASQEYVNALASNRVPSYITDPADQAHFLELVGKINATGDFTRLNAEDQYAFNTLRDRGSLDDNAGPVGGAHSGVYAWDPDTMTGDLPPGASRIADVIKDHASPDYRPPAPAPTTGHYITLAGGRYVYADDGSPVPPDVLEANGLRISSSSSTPARSSSSSTPAPDDSSNSSSAAAAVNRAPVNAAAIDDAGAGSSSSSSSSRTKVLLIATGASIGVLALAASLATRKRR